MESAGTFGYFSGPMRRPAETLDDLIDASGLSLGETSTASGVSPRALLKLREGKVAKAQPRTVARLANALGVDPARVRAAIEASRKKFGE